MVRPILNFHRPTDPRSTTVGPLLTKAVPDAPAEVVGQYPDLVGAPDELWPERFTVFEVYQNIFKRLWAKFPHTRPGRGGVETYAKPVGPGVFRGVDAYITSWPDPADKPTELRFLDNFGNVSGSLRVLMTTQQVLTRGGRGQATLDPSLLIAAATGVALPGPVSIKLSGGRTAQVTFTVEAGDDPPITASVMTPWADGDLNLQQWLFDRYLLRIGERDGVGDLADAFQTEFAEELAGEAAAEFATFPQSFDLGDNEQLELTVQLQAARPGRFMFAVRLLNEHTGAVTVSDIVTMEAQEGSEGLFLAETVWF